ncbi:MAG: tRNA (adenosine(37)-N6)-dimethylallyltransferase MiaA [Patescibacteria group bacterium]|nr:tRNA (adenosine(37)-N6)-dimethylallyltransferase MiaA [Patescibacteria group bacterium]
MQKVIAVVGPTAVGKSFFGVWLAKQIGGEIISADSRQVYIGLDIGTGKMTAAEMNGVPHHLLSVADPKDTYTVADFLKAGRAAIEAVGARGHFPIVVGGSGFYIDALLGKREIADVPPNKKLRKELEKVSLDALNVLLRKLDPARAETIDAKNRVRLVRAIEIARTLGSVPNVSAQQSYSVFWVGIQPSQNELYANIHARLLARMKAGMLEEARHLHATGLSFERMEELGLEYRFMATHLKGENSEKEMLTELEKEIRKYAKRQMTWFKRNKEIQWFTAPHYPEILAQTEKYLNLNG